MLAQRAFQPRSGCIIKPNVAALRLPWDRHGSVRRNPVRVAKMNDLEVPRVAEAPTLGFVDPTALRLLPILGLNRLCSQELCRNRLQKQLTRTLI